MNEQDFNYEKRRVIADFVIYGVISVVMVFLGVLFGLGILHK